MMVVNELNNALFRDLIKIWDVRCDCMLKTKIIAEIAGAHEGCKETLKQLVMEAAVAGADAVKFQWYKYDYLATPDYEWYETYKRLFIDESVWVEMLKYAKQNGLEVWVDVFDTWGVEMAKTYHQEVGGFKIPPTVLQSKYIMEELIALEKPLLLGVGGWYDDEIEEALLFLKERKCSSVTLMYGFQGYPTKEEDVNLKRLIHLKKFGCPVGFADHEDAEEALATDLPVYAYIAGSCVIEKHITLNRKLKGTDYYSALEPVEFYQMVKKIRQAELLMGDIHVSEGQRAYLKDTLTVVAKKEIEEGEIITFDKVSYKRARTSEGFMLADFEKSLPLVSTTNLKVNQSIKPTEVEKPKITIVVIARLKSTRLKKKALLPIHGVESIKRCILNCLSVQNVDEVVLATSNLTEDEPLTKLTFNQRVRVVTGDPDNVANRILAAIENTGTSVVIRVTGDNPAVSPEMMEYLIQQHLHGGADCTLPNKNHAVGIGADVYSVGALKKLVSLGKPLNYTEYLSFYFMNNPHLFHVNIVELPSAFQFPQWRLTLDEPKDYEMFNQLYSGLGVGEEAVSFAEIRKYLGENPHIAEINKMVALKWRDNEQMVEEINQSTTFLE